MNKIKKLLVLGTFGVLLSFSLAEAHQPNFVNKTKEIEILNPEISQAFYGFLDEKPVIYSIKSSEPFKLYTNILVPDVASPEPNMFLSIKSGEEELALLDGLNNFTWTHWYEEFAGDWYWKGPEFSKNIAAGEYTITVYNQLNRGEYVLVVGEAESFPINKMPGMFIELYKIKTSFFEKPWYSVFQNKIGGFLGIILIVVGAIIAGIILIRKRVKGLKNAK